MSIVIGIDPSLNGTAVVTVMPPALNDPVLYEIHGDLRDKAKKVATSLLEQVIVRKILPRSLKGPERLDYNRQELISTLDQFYPDLVVVEGYSFGSKVGREVAGEWGGLVRWTLWNMGYPYLVVPPSTLKKYVTGKGNSPKAIMLREVHRRWGLTVDDDDVADAYGLARLGVEFLPSYGVRTKKFEAIIKKLEVVTGR